VGIDERWREDVKVVFRKRPEGKRRAEMPRPSDFRLPTAT
jgi:hypothetical protein